MLRVNKNDLGKIYYLFLVLLIAALVFFGWRVITKSAVTPIPTGRDGKVVAEIEYLQNHYYMGSVWDRTGTKILEGTKSGPVWQSDALERAYRDVLGADIEEVGGSTYKILPNCLWVYGTEDNRFTLKGLFYPQVHSLKPGGDVMLSLHNGLQQGIYQKVTAKGYPNAYVIVSNYKTGEICGIFGNVMQDGYHPGSAIKPFIAASALTINPELKEYRYHCTTANHVFSTSEGNRRINCVNGIEHGDVGMKEALQSSCNGFFVSLAQRVDQEDLIKEMKAWDFDSVAHYSQMTFNDNRFVKKDGELSDFEYLLGAIGQGNAVVTPAGLNFCTNALLNHGVRQEPIWYIGKKTASHRSFETIQSPDSREICEEEVAEQVISDMMVPERSGMYLPGFAAKTGTAQYMDSAGTVKWYTLWTTGGLVDEEYPYSITVCLDQSPGSLTSYDAGVLAKDILTYIREHDDFKQQ